VLGKVDGEAGLRYAWSIADYSNRYQLSVSMTGKMLVIAVRSVRATTELAATDEENL
jgi:hypothetical protein